MQQPAAQRLALNLRVELTKRDLGQADLQRLTGWTQATAHRRYRGYLAMSIDDAVHVARVTEIPLEALLDGVEEAHEAHAEATA